MYDPNNPWLPWRPVTSGAEWIAQEMAQRSAVLREMQRLGQLPDHQVASAPTPPPPQPEVRPVTSVRRPRRKRKGLVDLGDAIPVPQNMQLIVALRAAVQADDLYVTLQQVATDLYDGHLASLLTGDGDVNDAATGSYLGAWFARWALAVALRFAPDEHSRINAGSALQELPGLPLVGGSPPLGPEPIVSAFIDSGVAALYRPVFDHHSTLRDILCAAVFQTDDRDPALLDALGLTGVPLPEPGWATRCTHSLWSGVMPSELSSESTDNGVRLTGPSFWAFFSASHRGGPQGAQGLLNAIASVPGIPVNRPLHRQFAFVLAATGASWYQQSLSEMPLLRDALAAAVQHGIGIDPLCDTTTCAFLSIPTSR
jgi:hypothetical protein